MFFNFNDFAGHHGHHGHEEEETKPKKPVDTTSLYKVLDLEKDAPQNTIKKAFYKAAKKHHPDKGGDEEIFKDVNKAWKILGDAEKRELYDKWGEEGVEAGGKPDPYGRQMRKRGKPKGENIKFSLPVSLEDFYNGKVRKLSIKRKVMCTDCGGKGGKNVKKCSDCHGRGIKIIKRRIAPGMVEQMQTHCPSCRGVGEMIADKDKCKGCNTRGIIQKQEVLEVQINRGMQYNSKVVFKGKSDEIPGYEAGDVHIILKPKKHPIFTREGASLFVNKTITLEEALTGFKFILKHLDGRQILVESSPGHIYKPDDVQALKEEGMPLERNPYEHGALFVIFKIEFPERITQKQAKALAQILPKPEQKEGDKKDTKKIDEVVKLADVNVEAARRYSQRRQQQQHEDERGGVQCQTQ